MSTAEPGIRPVTFRAMFTEELRARRQQMGLLQREFGEGARLAVIGQAVRGGEEEAGAEVRHLVR